MPSLPFAPIARRQAQPRRALPMAVAVSVPSANRVREWATGPDPFARVISIRMERIRDDGPVYRVLTSDGRQMMATGALGSWLSDNWKGVLGGIVGLSLLPGIGGALGLGAGAGAAGSVGSLIGGIGSAVGSIAKTVATVPLSILGGVTGGGKTPGIAGSIISPSIVNQTVQTAGQIAVQQALNKNFDPIDVAVAQGQISPQQAAQLKQQRQAQEQAQAQAAEVQRQQQLAMQQAEMQRQQQLAAEQAAAQQAAQQREMQRAQIVQLYQQYQAKLQEAQQNYQLANSYNQPALAQQWAAYYNSIAQYLQQLQQAYAQV